MDALGGRPADRTVAPRIAAACSRRSRRPGAASMTHIQIGVALKMISGDFGSGMGGLRGKRDDETGENEGELLAAGPPAVGGRRPGRPGGRPCVGRAA